MGYNDSVAADVDMANGVLALMREVKLDLYSIARQAELGNDDQIAGVQARAEQSMRLIDSYILSAQAEYGQLQLDLEPLAIGSVLHEVAHSMRSVNRQVDIQAKANQPVMTHRAALHGLLTSAGRLLADSTDSKLILRSFTTTGNDIGVGVFAKNLDLTTDDIRSCLQLRGKAHMPLARHSSSSGVTLVVADALARALGGSLEVKRMGSLRGLATILPKSDQLALI